MRARKRPEVIDIEISRDAVSTYLIAKKKSFEAEVDNETIESFAIVKKKKKNSNFEIFVICQNVVDTT